MTTTSRTITAILTLLSLLILASPVAAVEPTEGAFLRIWQRTDLPVTAGEATRTWTWGPGAFTLSQREPYAEAPGGERLVQYFDKGRMEIMDPDGDSDVLWYVTSGLLVDEMIKGAIQVGDAQYQGHGVAQLPVAGDTGSGFASPTYASLKDLTRPVEDRAGQTIDSRLNPLGEVSTDASLAAQGVAATFYDDLTGHNIADRFWQFMNAELLIYEDGSYQTGQAYPDAFYVTGRALTEPYWAEVSVVGTVKLVLLQCFQRRCLTYTPDNPDGWQVEMGNVGEHYYEWRYRGFNSRPGQIAFSLDGDIWAVSDYGKDPVQLTSGVDLDHRPAWSPDGQQLAFIRIVSGPSPSSTSYELWRVNADGSDLVKLDDLGSYGQAAGIGATFDWSPDGSRIAYNAASSRAVIRVINADGSNRLTLTPDLTGASFDLDWSPAGERIVFKHFHTPSDPDDQETGIFKVNADGSELEQLTFAGFHDSDPNWSPDGLFIAFDRGEFGSDKGVYIMDAGGGGVRLITDGIPNASAPRWSPDGALVSFVADSRLWIVNADSTSPMLLTPDTFVDQVAAWSPSMLFIAYAGLGDSAGIYTIRFDGEFPHVLVADGGATLAWGP